MIRLLAMLLAALILFCGCDVDWPDEYRSAVVEGTIEFDGASLVDADIVFLPQRFDNGAKRVPIAVGKTDAQGKFLLRTDLESRDAAPQVLHGNYRVLVSRKVDGKELIPESYNRKSLLQFKHDTQEAYSRPVFKLTSDGRVEWEPDA